MSDETKGQNLPSDLPAMESEFDVEVEGEITRKRYAGTFYCKILNRKGRALADRHKAVLNGSNPEGLKLDILQLHHRISYLKYALVEPFPKFWSDSDFGYELYDGNVVDKVYEQVLKFETQWMEMVWSKEVVQRMTGAKG